MVQIQFYGVSEEEIYTQNDKSEKFHVELRVDQILRRILGETAF